MEQNESLPVIELLTIAELALRLQVKKSWAYAHARELGGVRLGKYWRFVWKDVLKRIEHGVPSR